MRAHKNDRKPSHRDYEIGRGKPPTAFQFKPGQSGNPKGRPKGARNFTTDVRAMLKAPVKVAKDGKARKVSTQEASLMRLREQALGGNARALDRLLALAAFHNNDEFTASVAKMSADDEVIFGILAERIRSGAIHPTTATSPGDEAVGLDQAARPDKPGNDAQNRKEDDEA